MSGLVAYDSSDEGEDSMEVEKEDGSSPKVSPKVSPTLMRIVQLYRLSCEVVTSQILVPA
jgi:hypothetical protein